MPCGRARVPHGRIQVRAPALNIPAACAPARRRRTNPLVIGRARTPGCLGSNGRARTSRCLVSNGRAPPANCPPPGTARAGCLASKSYPARTAPPTSGARAEPGAGLGGPRNPPGSSLGAAAPVAASERRLRRPPAPCPRPASARHPLLFPRRPSDPTAPPRPALPRPGPLPRRHFNRKSCPFAHPGEHARRRSLEDHTYSADMCPHVRAGEACPAGDACPFAHHVFEVRAASAPARHAGGARAAPQHAALAPCPTAGGPAARPGAARGPSERARAAHLGRCIPSGRAAAGGLLARASGMQRNPARPRQRCPRAPYAAPPSHTSLTQRRTLPPPRCGCTPTATTQSCAPAAARASARCARAQRPLHNAGSTGPRGQSVRLKGWDGMGSDATRRDGMGCDGVGRDGRLLLQCLWLPRL
jgi:hypothetical protein